MLTTLSRIVDTGSSTILFCKKNYTKLCQFTYELDEREKEVLLEVSGAEYVHGVDAHVDKYVPGVTARGVEQKADQFFPYPLPVVLLQVVTQEYQNRPGRLRAHRSSPLKEK